MLLFGLRALVAVLPHAPVAVRDSITSLLWIVRRCCTFGVEASDVDYAPNACASLASADTRTDSDAELSDAAASECDARQATIHTFFAYRY
jgi:hypothetical protein